MVGLRWRGYDDFKHDRSRVIGVLVLVGHASVGLLEIDDSSAINVEITKSEYGIEPLRLCYLFWHVFVSISKIYLISCEILR